jgi:putative spermidine/putrescine transport system permease protein
MKQRLVAAAAITPYALFILVLLVVPAVGIFELSWRQHSATNISGTGFTTSNYLRLFEPYYLKLIWETVKLSLIATVVEAVIGFPVAYAMARSRPAVKAMLGVLLMVPLMTSVVVKTFGWYIIFGSEGPFTGLWRSMGASGGSIIGTEFAVIVGMVEFGLPFMIFSLAASIEKISPSLEEAAANLGASPGLVLLRVLLPLSKAGMLSGFLLCLGVSASAYVVPAVLGGTKVKMAAQQIYEDVLVAFNWPGAAAVSMLLLLVLSTLLSLAIRTGRSDK